MILKVSAPNRRRLASKFYFVPLTIFTYALYLLTLKPYPTAQTIIIRTVPITKIDLTTCPDRKIALINRHLFVAILCLMFVSGAGQDFAYVAKNIGFSYVEISPSTFAEYGQSRHDSDYINSRYGLHTWFCTCFSTVVVIDTIPDSRFLMQALASGQNCTVEKLLLVTTNRFDFVVADREDYYSLIKKLAVDPRVEWIANNPWEQRYASLRLGGNYLDFRLVRPFGYTSLPQYEKLPENVASQPCLIEYPNILPFIESLKNASIPFVHLKKRYGGPSALKQYKLEIAVPYQTSTMKMYENLANGVVTYVPSPRLLKVLINEPGYELSAIKNTLAVGKGWENYIEFYNDELRDFYYIFDSLEELRDILLRDDIDPKNVRGKAPIFWEKVRELSLLEWRNIFSFLNL